MSRKPEKILKTRFKIKPPDQTKLLRVVSVIICIAAIGIFVVCAALSIQSFIDFLPQTVVEESSEQEEESSSDSEQNLDEKLLTLVNSSSALPDDYIADIVEYDGIEMDACLTEALGDMLEAALMDGIAMEVTEGYISYEEQERLHSAEVDRLMTDEGYTSEAAEELAQATVPSAGYAEAQTGLSLRLVGADGTEDEEVYKWLSRNGYKYGFILRYPEDKTDETDHDADTGLYRYVGTDYATKMLTLGMCLEEYVAYLDSR